MTSSASVSALAVRGRAIPTARSCQRLEKEVNRPMRRARMILPGASRLTGDVPPYPTRTTSSPTSAMTLYVDERAMGTADFRTQSGHYALAGEGLARD